MTSSAGVDRSEHSYYLYKLHELSTCKLAIMYFHTSTLIVDTCEGLLGGANAVDFKVPLFGALADERRYASAAPLLGSK